MQKDRKQSTEIQGIKRRKNNADRQVCIFDEQVN
jgi:hypothetical protein